MRLLLGILLLSIISCKPADVSTTGKYIDKITKSIVTFDDGSELKLDDCANCKSIFLVRHAEKDTIPKKNPILTEQGYQRANNLAQIFKSTRLDAVYSTLYNRTMHTVDSLTNMKGVATKIYQPKDLKKLSEELLSDSSLNNVLVSGHSNTTPGLAGALMGKKQFEKGFDESDYDNLLIINLNVHGEKVLYKLRYGVE